MEANTTPLTTLAPKNKDIQMKNVDVAERQAFLQSIHDTNYAGIEAVQNIYHAISLSAHREAFLRGKRGDRDGQRAALFLEAGQLKNAAARVLSFFVAIARKGYNGTICTEDVLASQVVAATGGLCAPRTFRRALADLCRAGWLHKDPMSTGTKILTPSGWKTNQVNKITIPWCTRLLGIRKTKPVESTNTNIEAQKVECCSDSNDSNPRPKLPAMGERRENPPPNRGGSSLSIVNVKDNASVRNEECELAAAPPSAASPPQTSPQLKQQSVGEARKARKPAKKAGAPFGRIARSKIPRTWQNGRILLLHDLELAGAGAGAGVPLRIATLQTDLKYPPLFPIALPWEKYVSSWIERDWKERQRIVRREIMPQLAAWCLPLVPPDPDALRPGASPEAAEKAREQMRQFDRVSKIMRSLPEMLITQDTPRFVAEKMQECAWHLRQLPMLIFTGRMGLDDISRGQRQAFFEVAKLLNLAD
jgi:hypothetical protein